MIISSLRGDGRGRWREGAAIPGGGLGSWVTLADEPVRGTAPDHQQVTSGGRHEIEMAVVIQIGQSDRVDLIAQPNDPVQHTRYVDGDLSLSTIGTYADRAGRGRGAVRRRVGNRGEPQGEAHDSQTEEVHGPHWLQTYRGVPDEVKKDPSSAERSPPSRALSVRANGGRLPVRHLHAAAHLPQWRR